MLTTCDTSDRKLLFQRRAATVERNGRRSAFLAPMTVVRLLLVAFVSATVPACLDGLPKKAQYELQRHDNAYKLDGGSNADVRKVGKYWVAVEIPRKDPAGIRLSVFTNQPFE
ncbi:MAG: hypothetical protein HYV09_06545 [Deltaproteobacteria bacterium]|nr:hypothetical protein [Deltaproteobacteria bacterium]